LAISNDGATQTNPTEKKPPSRDHIAGHAVGIDPLVFDTGKIFPDVYPDVTFYAPKTVGGRFGRCDGIGWS
jgi:hypothetical protein